MQESFQAEVALFSPPFTTLSYLLPQYLPESCWMPGQRIVVPLGKGVRSGIILDICPLKKNDYQMKIAIWPLEKHPLLPKWYFDFTQQLALRHTSSIGQILANILPAGLRSTQTRIRVWGKNNPIEYKINSLLSLNKEQLNQIGKAWISEQADFISSTTTVKESEHCFLLKDPPWPVRPVAKNLISILEFLLQHGSVSRKRIVSELGKSASTPLTKLVSRGLVGIKPQEQLVSSELQNQEVNYSSPCFSLTDSQQEVFIPLLKALDQVKSATHLLFGVTGSGKTAIYLELARQSLIQKRSVLLLAPEVALAHKLWNDLKNALPQAPAFLFHGYLSPIQKEYIYKDTATQKIPRIIVGTRSALFLPLENIGLIVLDEEHDSSFKQEEGFNYQAKEVAWYRAGKENALLLLGSATPDLKSYYAAKKLQIPIHTLTKRVQGGNLPELRFVTIPKGKADAGILVQESLDSLYETVNRGDQAIILLNRRGYAPLMYCLGCGTVTKCPHCDIGLAYHKGRERLICHYCGYTVPFPSPCSFCKGMHFLPMGEGTEKLEENLSAFLPAGTGILRLDRDSTRRVGKMEEILSRFAKKEASVLVGTQMLSKGHHFPDVTLAIVADADLGLNLPDYRAAERTFQLLLQSAGRSGRGEKQGQVIIQTRDPSHYCWSYVKNSDYEGFFEREIALRKRRLYPPFVKLALIRISHEMDYIAQDDVSNLGKLLRQKGKELALTVLGPAPAPLPFLKGRKRFHCLIKSDDWQKIRTLFSLAQASVPRSKLRLTLDLDPVNML